jgi:Putative lumazine-binding
MDNPSFQDDDETKIRAAALDYIAAVLEADPARMERCLHPDLVKRAYLPGIDGRPQLSHISALNLIHAAKTFPVDPSRHAEVTILDRYEGAASVKTTFDKWIDYMHVVNVGGDWKIIHVLWEVTRDVWASRTNEPRSSAPSWQRGGSLSGQ